MRASTAQALMLASVLGLSSFPGFASERWDASESTRANDDKSSRYNPWSETLPAEPIGSSESRFKDEHGQHTWSQFAARISEPHRPPQEWRPQKRKQQTRQRSAAPRYSATPLPSPVPFGAYGSPLGYPGPLWGVPVAPFDPLYNGPGISTYPANIDGFSPWIRGW